MIKSCLFFMAESPLASVANGPWCLFQDDFVMGEKWLRRLGRMTSSFSSPPSQGAEGRLSYDIIVKQHAGSIDVDTRPGEFTEFRVVLPRTAATSKAGATG